GLFDGHTRSPKFEWGQPVSNHPGWKWQAGVGMALAALVFIAALAAGRLQPQPLKSWLPVALSAAVSRTMIRWGLVNIPIGRLPGGDWLRSLSWGVIALAAPVLAAAAIVTGTAAPGFARVIGRRTDRVESSLAIALGLTLIILTLLAVQAALGLAF